jgi:tRNA threonylcarbamoyladenosine biosynthesis protein TsaE
MAGHHNPLQRFLATTADTNEFGAALAPLLRPGMVVFLCGELGAGKTTLVRGLLRELGVKERVKSPTYTLVEPYVISGLYLYHFDFYRFSRSDEWVEAGFRDYFNRESICLVEWPEKAGGQLPAPDLRIVMEVDGNGRSITVSADTEAGQDCLVRLHR